MRRLVIVLALAALLPAASALPVGPEGAYAGIAHQDSRDAETQWVQVLDGCVMAPTTFRVTLNVLAAHDEDTLTLEVGGDALDNADAAAAKMGEPATLTYTSVDSCVEFAVVGTHVLGAAAYRVSVEMP